MQLHDMCMFIRESCSDVIKRERVPSRPWLSSMVRPAVSTTMSMSTTVQHGDGDGDGDVSEHHYDYEHHGAAASGQQ